MKLTGALRRIPQWLALLGKKNELRVCSPKACRSAGGRLPVKQSVCLFAFYSFVVLMSLWSGSLRAQLQAVPVISLVAGTGTQCQTQPCGDGGAATSATLGQPWGVIFDTAGNLYFSSGTTDPRVRKIDTNGIITTIAGNGTACSSSTASCGDGGPATSANLSDPVGIAMDSQGNIYIADRANNRIRKFIASNNQITTVAGTGTACSATTAACGDASAATSAQLNAPQFVAIDSSGNLYIADTADNRVRMVTPGGTISTVVGTGATCTSTTGGCGDGAAATQASISQPRAFAFDNAGNLYIAEKTGQRIRQFNPTTGLISTVAGTGTQCSSTTAACGDGGAAINANFNQPTGLAFDYAGNLYISDQSDNRVRKVSVGTQVITTVAGNGNTGATGNGGDAVAATMTSPSGLAVTRAGDLYIGVGSSYQVRRVSFGTFGVTPVKATSVVQNVLVRATATQTITSVSVPASFGGKQEFTVGTMSGCTLNSSTASGTTCTIPVTFTPAYPGLRPMPLQIVTSTGTFSFSLTGIGIGPQVLLTPGIITTIAGTGTACSTATSSANPCGDGGSATSATLYQPRGNFTDGSGNVWIADSLDNRVRMFAPGGTITTIAGNGAACSSSTGACGDGGPATSAQLNAPRGVVVDPAGNVYIVDTGDHRVRMVAAGTGTISTIAGTGAICSATTAVCGDGGLGTAAQLNTPSGLTLDGQGNLYIADSGDHRIRLLAGGYISTVAGTGTPCSSTTAACGDGGPALSANFMNPVAIFQGTGPNLWIADTNDNRVREITWSPGAGPAQGIVTTIAGTGTACSSSSANCGDGSAATSANLNGPRGVVVDASGIVYVADYGTSRIRIINTGQVITTVVGNGTQGYSGDNGPAWSAAINQPRGISLDPAGNLIIADTFGNRMREVNVASSVMTFASTPYGTTSTDSPQTATLTNTGNAALTFPVPSSGQNPSIANNFQLSSSNSCPVSTSSSSTPFTLPSGMYCPLVISFVPQQIGSITGSLVATDNASSSTTQTIALSGTGTQDAPSVSLTSSSNPSNYGSPLTFTASLGYGCTGTISFQDGSTTLGSATIANGSASVTTSSLLGGSHSIVASYGGSTNCMSATSPAFSQTISKVAITVAGSSSLNPSLYGDSIQLSYVFTGVAGQATPTGSASLYDGSTLLSTLTLDASGHASFVTSALAASSHTLKVTYGGDTNYF